MDLTQQWTWQKISDAIGLGSGEIIRITIDHPIEFIVTSRAFAASVTGGGTEKIMVIKAGANGSFSKIQSIIVCANMGTSEVTTTAWLYTFILGH